MEEREGSRRGFLAGLLALPAAFPGAKAVASIGRAASFARPRADGTSATRCALCGARDHAMLGCPDARKAV